MLSCASPCNNSVSWPQRRRHAPMVQHHRPPIAGSTRPALWARPPPCPRPSGRVAATLDDPELVPLVTQMLAMRPQQASRRDKLDKALALIDEANSKDPRQVLWEGERVGYRLLFSRWLTEWVTRLDPQAPDELIILARGCNVESWRLADIKRDNYPPNSQGVKMWESDKRKAQANMLLDLVKQAGYGPASLRVLEEVMLERDVPDPRDIRLHDLVAPLGGVNYRLVEEAVMVQTLMDAQALVFMEKSFPQMFVRLDAEEVLAQLTRELSRVSNKCIATLLSMSWSPVQRKLISKALPSPRRYAAILKEIEGASAASSHPGDWRYRNFDYE
ncbi:hypothetical protein V8C86DRAFT_2784137 [Haematococcus lacustris]